MEPGTQTFPGLRLLTCFSLGELYCLTYLKQMFLWVQKQGSWFLSSYFFSDYHWSGIDNTTYDSKFKFSSKTWLFLFESDTLRGPITCHLVGALDRMGFSLWLKLDAAGEGEYDNWAETISLEGTEVLYRGWWTRQSNLCLLNIYPI